MARRPISAIALLTFIMMTGTGLRAQQCVEGLCSDGTGTRVWSNGDRYSGQWRNGAMDGTGTMTWANGKRYSGSWKKGLFHGWGTLNWPSGEWYEGFFADGTMEGTGTMKWSNGDRYTGQWEKGLMNGRGTMRYAKGVIVKGEWKDGKAVKEKPGPPGNDAMAGSWRIMCKCLPAPEAAYNCPSTSYIFSPGGGGSFEDRSGGHKVSGTVAWTLKGAVLTITQFAGARSVGNPKVFTYNPARRWYASRPAPQGPKRKIMTYCIIKKTGAK